VENLVTEDQVFLDRKDVEEHDFLRAVANEFPGLTLLFVQIHFVDYDSPGRWLHDPC